MTNEVVSSMQFQCRGVKSPSVEQRDTLDRKICALQSEAREGTKQELFYAHTLSLPVLAREDAVPVIVNTLKSGFRIVLCPFMDEHRCTAIAAADILGKDDITTEFCPEDDFRLPSCPYTNH